MSKVTYWIEETPDDWILLTHNEAGIDIILEHYKTKEEAVRWLKFVESKRW